MLIVECALWRVCCSHSLVGKTGVTKDGVEYFETDRYEVTPAAEGIIIAAWLQSNPRLANSLSELCIATPI